MIYLSWFLVLFMSFFVGLYLLSVLNNIFYKVPQVSTFNSDLSFLKSVFDKYNLNWKKIADLGSGTWKMLRFFEKNYNMSATWFEIDLSNVLISSFISKFFKLKNKSIKKNYVDASLKEFDFIYIYLFPCLMWDLEKKLFSKCSHGTVIFVNAFKLKNITPDKVYYKDWKEKLFVYEIKKSKNF